VIGETIFVLAEQFFDKSWVEEPSALQCGGGKNIAKE